MKPNYQRIVHERIFFVSFILVLAVFGSVSMLRTMSVGTTLQEIRTKNEQLMQEKAVLSHELVLVRAHVADLKKTMPGLSGKAIAEFKHRGLADPQKNIIDDLGSREELMPFRGVFGARPSFYTEVRMYVLNGRWAFASFNDGHNRGDRLYSFRVSRDGTISWTVLDTFMSEVSSSGVPTE